MQKVVRTTSGGYDELQAYLDDGYSVIMCNRCYTVLEYIIEKKEKNVVKKKRVDKKSYGEFGHVKLTDEEYNKLMNAIPKLQDWIRKCDEYIESTNKKYSSHYLTIKRWYEKENKKSDVLKGVEF